MNRTSIEKQRDKHSAGEEPAIMVLAGEGAPATMEPAEHAGDERSNDFQAWKGWSREEIQDGEPESNRNAFSQAMVWNAEPEWVVESNDAEGETAGGSREPETSSD
jgi:hypothetical protein